MKVPDAIELLEMINSYSLDFMNEADQDRFNELYEEYSRKYNFGEFSSENENKKFEAEKMKIRYEKIHFCPICPQKPFNILGLGAHCKTKHPELIKSEKSKFHKKDRDIDFDDVVFEIAKIGIESRKKFLVDKVFNFHDKTKKDNPASEHFKLYLEDIEHTGPITKELVRSFCIEDLELFNEKIDELGKFDEDRFLDKKIYWIQRNGNPIKIKKMDDQHLENTLRLLFTHNISDEYSESLDVMMKEKMRRIKSDNWNPGTNLGRATEEYVNSWNSFWFKDGENEN